jgi:hypothetical protein
MKRLITLMLAAVFVLGTVAASWAVHTQGAGGLGLDFNARGSWRAVAEYRDNWTFGDEEAADFDQGDFRLHQRARVWFDFTTADRVKAVMNLQMGSYNWGGVPSVYFGLAAIARRHRRSAALRPVPVPQLRHHDLRW